MSETFAILNYNLDLAEKELRRLERKAEKLGVEPLAWTVTGTEVRKVIAGEYNGKVYYRNVEYTVLEVEGASPRLAGWTFAATLEHTSAGNMIRRVPGVEEEIPAHFREGDPLCDHCRTQRRRKDTFLVFNEKSQWKQVGRSCLQDFLGSDVTYFLAALAVRKTLAGFGEYDEGDFSGGRVEPLYELGDFLAVVALCVRVLGWTSRTVARDMDDGRSATANDALWALSPSWTKEDRAKKEEFLAKQTDDDKTMAILTSAWLEKEFVQKPASARSEYEHNMVVAVQAHGGYVSLRHAGIVASAVAGYSRTVARELEKKERLNEYFGSLEPEVVTITRGKNKGKTKTKNRRYELTLTVERIIDVDTDWGTTWIHKMRDAEGRSFTWFGSSRLYDADRGVVDVGDAFSAVWSLKDHKEWKGVRETHLTRPSVPMKE